ncbi:nucleotidyltransferase domain-containing protein [Methanospirillum lacunae]|uniref:Polymerase nucleotidyl transferase domain-containing protein n=1 Tax=Methanospirillum lacunae TaxID=668570 RepID=A0A2V2NBG5_9EURY|nr:hypothetical protein DK846_00505 [Methanospirillum lacunae]
MKTLILNNRDKIDDICLKRNIISLTLFGSVTGDLFNPTKSDLDFLVEFDKMKVIMQNSSSALLKIWKNCSIYRLMSLNHRQSEIHTFGGQCRHLRS